MITSLRKKVKVTKLETEDFIHKQCGGRLMPLKGEGYQVRLRVGPPRRVVTERGMVRVWKCERCERKGELV